MNRIFYLSFILLLIVSCSKHSSPNPPATPPKESDTGLTISVGDAVGTIIRHGASDTFLIQVKFPGKLTAVPVVLHYAAGATPSEGEKLTDSTSSDTVDISQNQLHPITIVSASGKQAAYVVGFPYVITNIDLGYGQGVFALAVQGDTVYAGDATGLAISTDRGMHFTKTVTLPTGSEVLSVAAQNTTVYAGMAGEGLIISPDGGQTIRVYKFGGPADSLINNTITSVFAQGDTVYAGSLQNGLYISHDRGQHFSNSGTANGLPSNYGVTGVFAVGADVYVSNQSGVYLSQNGGISFSPTNYAATIVGAQGNVALTVNDGVIYAGYEQLWLSKDNGLTFSSISINEYDNITYGLSVRENVICAATDGGLLLSTDAGASFTPYNYSWGLSGQSATSVVYDGSKIYVGFMGSGGGVSVLVPR
jgi:hypothetical protein